MSESAGRVARQEAGALFKTHLRSREFGDQVKGLVRDAAQELADSMPQLSAEDAEVIARRVAEESMGSLAESEVLREKIEAHAKKTVEGSLSGKGFDEHIKKVAQEVANATPHVKPEDLEKALAEKTKTLEQQAKKLEETLGALTGKLDESLAGKVSEALAKVEEIAKDRPTKDEIAAEMDKQRQALMTSQDFGEWIKDGAKAALEEVGLADGMAGIKKAVLGADKVEKIARHEALTASMDVLETKEFTRRIADVLDEKVVRKKLQQVAGGDPDQMEQTAELQARNVFAELLESPEFSEKVTGLAGGSEEVKEVGQKLVERMDAIEKEGLPGLVEKLLTDKLSGVAPDAIAEKVQATVQEAIAGKLDPEALQQQVVEIAKSSIRDISNSPDFKAMLDGKFKVMMNYISQDVIPKQIKRLMGG
jgi:hypothetical protein